MLPVPIAASPPLLLSLFAPNEKETGAFAIVVAMLEVVVSVAGLLLPNEGTPAPPNVGNEEEEEEEEGAVKVDAAVVSAALTLPKVTAPIKGAAVLSVDALPNVTTSDCLAAVVVVLEVVLEVGLAPKVNPAVAGATAKSAGFAPVPKVNPFEGMEPKVGKAAVAGFTVAVSNVDDATAVDDDPEPKVNPAPVPVPMAGAVAAILGAPNPNDSVEELGAVSPVLVLGAAPKVMPGGAAANEAGTEVKVVADGTAALLAPFLSSGAISVSHEMHLVDPFLFFT